MKGPIAALIALPFFVGTALADPAERGRFAPLTSEHGLEAAHVDRADTATLAVAKAQLTPATIQDVDVNGDGEISFEELLAHDLKSGF